VRTTVVRRVPPLRCMHLRGILWVIFRVLLVGFGLFGPGAARAPFRRSNIDLFGVTTPPYGVSYTPPCPYRIVIQAFRRGFWYLSIYGFLDAREGYYRRESAVSLRATFRPIPRLPGVISKRIQCNLIGASIVAHGCLNLAKRVSFPAYQIF